jgi:hypothetical protein
LLSGFEVLLTPSSSICADSGAHLRSLSSSPNLQGSPAFNESPQMEQNPHLGKQTANQGPRFLARSLSGRTIQLGKKAAIANNRKAIWRRGTPHRGIPAVKEMVALADITALRDWTTIRKDDVPFALMFWSDFDIWKNWESAFELPAMLLTKQSANIKSIRAAVGYELLIRSTGSDV